MTFDTSPIATASSWIEARDALRVLVSQINAHLGSNPDLGEASVAVSAVIDAVDDLKERLPKPQWKHMLLRLSGKVPWNMTDEEWRARLEVPDMYLEIQDVFDKFSNKGRR